MSSHKFFRPNYFFQWSSKVPHVAQADINGDGIGVPIAVVAIDDNNQDLYYIRLDRLDEIDLRRLTKILGTRDSARYPLWDLLSQNFLVNGMNALTFFHQLVKVRTISGQNTNPMGSTGNGIPLHQMFGLGAAYRGPASAGQVAFEHHLEVSPVDQTEAESYPSYDAYEGYDQTDIGDTAQYSVQPPKDAQQAPKKRVGRPKRNA